MSHDLNRNLKTLVGVMLLVIAFLAYYYWSALLDSETLSVEAENLVQELNTANKTLEEITKRMRQIEDEKFKLKADNDAAATATQVEIKKLTAEKVVPVSFILFCKYYKCYDSRLCEFSIRRTKEEIGKLKVFEVWVWRRIEKVSWSNK